MQSWYKIFVCSRESHSDDRSQIGRCVLTLRAMILQGDFSPGERISELKLAARLSVSRTPLRLALDRLCHEGLLEVWPTGGFIVREFTLADIWDAIEIRGVLEGTAARLAAERLISPGELTSLRKCCQLLGYLVPVSADSFSRYLELNDAFHAELKRLSKSPLLVQAIDRVSMLPFAAPGALVMGGAESQESARESGIAQEHHRAILEAIENREGARAEAVAREHSRVARRNLARALEDKLLKDRVPGAPLIRMPPAIGDI
jgi:GntR family transcriptional regulator of vanillate catabolism